MDALKSLFEGFDFAAFIPEVDTVLGWVELIARLAVMAGPLLLLGFGLVYLLAPPKEEEDRYCFSPITVFFSFILKFPLTFTFRCLRKSF